jgi:hypothetical protein
MPTFQKFLTFEKFTPSVFNMFFSSAHKFKMRSEIFFVALRFD